jgi:hypothetical protein
LSARKALSAIAISASILLATTGCSLTPAKDIASMQDYAPSDGSQVVVGKLKLRNAFILTNGTTTALFGSVVNSGLEDIEATIQYTAKDGVKSNISFPVFAGEKLDLGYNGSEPVVLDVEAVEGTNVQVWLLDNVNAGQSLNVPVLSGAKSEYSELFSLLGE